MARYASPHQLALTEEIVPLDGLDLIDGDGAEEAKPAEAAAAGAGLGVIEPLASDLGREEPASTEPADAPVAERGTRATQTEGDDMVEQDSAKLADEREPWVASVDDSDPAPARRPRASSRGGPSQARLGGRALAIGVVVLVVVGVVVAAFASGLTQRAAPAHRATKAPVAGQPVPLSVPYRKPAARRARRPQRRHHHRRRRHHHGAHRRHRSPRHGGARSHGAPPAPAAASGPAPAPAAPPPPRGAVWRRESDQQLGRPVGRIDGRPSAARRRAAGAGRRPGSGASSDPTFEAGF